jgi:hypothetical protein
VQQADVRHESQRVSATLNVDENLAIWALRRVTGRGWNCDLSCTARPAHIEKELADIADRFRCVFGGMCPMRLAMSGSHELTKDERRLLHAIAAAQAEDAQLLDNYLYKLALNRSIRAPLAEAVKSLAACLAVHGYWLPQPPEAIPVPAAALRLARAQGHDLHDIHVAWP